MTGTPKARALGSALRQAREEKGLTLRAFAKQINRDIAQLSRWETGEKTPKPEQVAQILTALDVNGDRFEEIISLSYGTNEPLWVASTLPEQQRQLTALLDLASRPMRWGLTRTLCRMRQYLSWALAR